MHSFALKFVLIGDCNVGKSQLSRQYTRKPFLNETQSTVGLEFATRLVEFEKCTIKAQIWDTAGQERYNSMTKHYFRDAVGALFVYDTTNRNSFDSLKDKWSKLVHEYANEDLLMVLVGNKADVSENQPNLRQVSIDDGIEFAKSRNMDFIEVSAKSGEGVETAFRRLILSSARKIPDIRVPLELTCLPEGWIMQVPPLPSSIDSTQSDLSIKKLTTQVSDEGSTSGDSRMSSIGTRSGTRSHSHSMSTYRDSSIGSFAEVGRRVIYVNYWTGDTQLELPIAPAPTGLIYTNLVRFAPKTEVNTTDSTDCNGSNNDNEEQLEFTINESNLRNVPIPRSKQSRCACVIM